MASVLDILLPIAEGRGSNPDEGAGVLLIIGIIVLALVVVGTILFLVTRLTARRGRSPGHEG